MSHTLCKHQTGHSSRGIKGLRPLRKADPSHAYFTACARAFVVSSGGLPSTKVKCSLIPVKEV